MKIINLNILFLLIAISGCHKQAQQSLTVLFSDGHAHWYSIDYQPPTVDQYNECASAGRCVAMDSQPRDATIVYAQLDWSSASAFCLWRHAHLPTRGEWEYATRGNYVNLLHYRTSWLDAQDFSALTPAGSESLYFPPTSVVHCLNALN